MDSDSESDEDDEEMEISISEREDEVILRKIFFIELQILMHYISIHSRCFEYTRENWNYFVEHFRRWRVFVSITSNEGC